MVSKLVLVHNHELSPPPPSRVRCVRSQGEILVIAKNISDTRNLLLNRQESNSFPREVRYNDLGGEREGGRGREREGGREKNGGRERDGRREGGERGREVAGERGREGGWEREGGREGGRETEGGRRLTWTKWLTWIRRGCQLDLI